ncbi:MAG: BrnA antitoxin family protein [Methylococcales bacterium]
MVQWFKKQGLDYQTRMNAVLRSFCEAHMNES